MRWSKVSQALAGAGVDHSQFLYGIASVHAALTARRRMLSELYLSGTDKLARADVSAIYQLARNQGLPVHFCGKKRLERLIPEGSPHQHVVLGCSALPVLDDETALLKDMDSDGSGSVLWLVLDGIHDPMNLGAMVRSAMFFGVDRVVLTGAHCPPTPTVSRVSSGALEGMPLWRAPSLGTLTRNATDAGWAVHGAVAPLSRPHPKLITHLQLLDCQPLRRMLVATTTGYNKTIKDRIFCIGRKGEKWGKERELSTE